MERWYWNYRSDWYCQSLSAAYPSVTYTGWLVSAPNPISLTHSGGGAHEQIGDVAVESDLRSVKEVVFSAACFWWETVRNSSIVHTLCICFICVNKSPVWKGVPFPESSSRWTRITTQNSYRHTGKTQGVFDQKPRTNHHWQQFEAHFRQKTVDQSTRWPGDLRRHWGTSPVHVPFPSQPNTAGVDNWYPWKQL